MKKIALTMLASIVVAIGFTTDAAADGPWHYPGRTRADRSAAYHAARQPWHGNYNYTPAGRPVALVVPPTANMQSHWGWGVGRTQMSPIYHQFARPYPGNGAAGGSTMNATPNWPSHSTQFGVYYIRGPW